MRKLIPFIAVLLFLAVLIGPKIYDPDPVYGRSYTEYANIAFQLARNEWGAFTTAVDVDLIINASDSIDPTYIDNTELVTELAAVVGNDLTDVIEYDDIRTASPKLSIVDSDFETTDESAPDSGGLYFEADSIPSMAWYNHDGDTWTIIMDNDDAFIVTGATTCEFDGDMEIYSTTAQLVIYDSAADPDSEKVVIEAEGEPSITFYGTDGDADTWSIAIDGDDQMVIAGASGGVNIDGPVEIAGALTAVLMTEAVTAETEAVSATESGKVYVQTRTSTTVTFTLPEAAAGLTYTFVCGHADSEILITPQTDDAIVTKTHAAEDGAALAPAASTGIKNTAATNVAGDQITLVALDAVTWYGVAQAGIWASQ
ncbi:MAG: hypothetical protein ACYS80_10740 [Planctomycetota bacterium]|jgi:hypothetical protein